MTLAGGRRPRVVLLTGEPGSGKTGLGLELARALHVPFLARDQVRRGLHLTAGGWGDEPVAAPTAEEAVEAFLRIIETIVDNDVSCIVEYVVRAAQPEHPRVHRRRLRPQPRRDHRLRRRQLRLTVSA